ncbi:M10 family metallopeptidase domain-containing protein [Pengzhenrongella sicca]|uniref:Peptidase metallopeptidase domain-containing protein n=1 Tax=Pengzhenrongella sicca TaxID=2819238 RepID=A0A8A4ZE00_9MICO|nr:hypothetical protein [Pengzhenrongella sicca]QTE30134.1 hypothetical protein J4E96_03695 [Pengzhenrongella sicca]
MTLPPDDAPRSASGRVPRWVRDERAGRPTPVTEWRESNLSSRPARRRRSAGRRRLRTRGSSRGPRQYPAAQAPSSARGLSPRRQRLQPFLVAFVVLVAVAGLGANAYERNPHWFETILAAVPTSADLADHLPAETLADLADRTSPPPGVEEQAARLAPAPVIAAPSSQFTFTATQVTADGRTVPVGWSPCRPVHYVVNPAGAPEDFADQVVLAMSDLSAATGLTFIADGVTDEPPAAPRTYFQPDRYGDRWAPVLIAVSTEQALPTLAGDVAGVGGYVSVSDPATGLSTAVTGDVYLDAAILGESDPEGGPAYPPVLRHELGHLVGLGHIEDPTQLMNPTTGAVTTYQGGDLAGLAQVGAAECAPGV